VPAKVLSFLVLATLFACTSPTATQEKNHMLNEATARKYAAAWANKVHANLQDLKPGSGGDFFGQLGSLGFDYLARESTLAVRAYIFAYDAEVTSQPDLLPWLNRVAAQDPESVSHGVFETGTPRWEPDKPPSLFLRIDLRDGSQSESDVLSRLMKLREDALIWRRNKLTKVMGDLVRQQRQESGRKK
jgi:hypothetical protein